LFCLIIKHLVNFIVTISALSSISGQH